jgi:DNA-binding CsgD family transcriptional regulator
MMLTPRETEIARLCGTGMSYKHAARLLGVSWHTVKTHIHNALAKTGTKNRRELADRIAAGAFK